jgi:hypothetical protein
MASAEDYARWIVNNADKQGTPEFETVAKAYELARAGSYGEEPPKFQPELGKLEGMPKTRRAAYRVPSAMAMQEITSAAGGPAEFLSQHAKAFARGFVKSPGETADLPVNLYNLSPTTLAGVTPTLEPVGVKAIEESLKLKQTPAQYAPTEYLGSLAGGGIIGGAVKGGVATANALQKFFRPKLANYLAAADGKGGEILNWLQGAKEIVPGSQPTVAEALAAAPDQGRAFTRFAGLQPSGAGQIPEELRAAYNVRTGAQEAAREAAVGRVAGTPMSMQMAEGQRLAKTEPLYEATRDLNLPVDVAPLSSTIDSLIAANPRQRKVVDKLASVKENIDGITNGREAVSALDDLKTMMKEEKDTFTLGVLKQVKDEFVKTVPGLEEAETAFREASKPINTMNIGAYLKDALTGALPAGTERAGAYAAALKNAPATIKKSTGQARFTSLKEAGVPDTDIKRLTDVAEDLNRSLAAKSLQSKGGATITKDPTVPKANLLNRTATLFNEFTSILTSYVGQRKAIEIAFEMLDPKVAADVLEQAMKMEAKQAARAAAAARVGPVTQAASVIAAPINALAPQNQNQNSLAGR